MGRQNDHGRIHFPCGLDGVGLFAKPRRGGAPLPARFPSAPPRGRAYSCVNSAHIFVQFSGLLCWLVQMHLLPLHCLPAAHCLHTPLLLHLPPAPPLATLSHSACTAPTPSTTHLLHSPAHCRTYKLAFTDLAYNITVPFAGPISGYGDRLNRNARVVGHHMTYFSPVSLPAFRASALLWRCSRWHAYTQAHSLFTGRPALCGCGMLRAACLARAPRDAVWRTLVAGRFWRLLVW